MIMYAIILSTIAILTHNTTAITMLTMHHVTITTKTIAVQILILEDAADTEDNILNMTEAYSTIFGLYNKCWGDNTTVSLPTLFFCKKISI